MTVGGLPLHPLVVHAAVVLLPGCALAIVALLLRPRWQERYGALLATGLVVSPVAGFVARWTGEDLAAQVGSPGQHQVWGERLPWAALAMAATGCAWLWMDRRQREAASARRAQPTGSFGSLAPGSLAAVAALTVLWMTFMTGHTGAEQTWAGRTAGASGAAPSPSISSRDGQYTMAQVAEHATGASCWSAINGDVYDLTTWIANHPGGPSAIRSICGQDGSAGFNSRHAGTQEALAKLPDFKIGTLLR